MKVSDLYRPRGPFVDQELYIVGLGPSMRDFPVEALRGRLCLLLNDAHRYFPQLGPVAFANHDSFLGVFDRERERWARVNGQLLQVELPDGNPHEANIPGDAIRYQVCRARSTRPFEADPRAGRDDNLIPWDHPSIYAFSYRSRAAGDDWDYSDDRALWAEPCHYWSSVQGTVAEFALQFAAWCGARTIYLVGVDCGPIAGRHYFHRELEDDRRRRAIGGEKGRDDGGRRDDQAYVRAKNYRAYKAGIERLKGEIRSRFGIDVLTLSPYVGIGGPS